MSKIKKPLYVFIAILTMFSCTRDEQNVNEDEIIFGLASPVFLNPLDTAFIVVKDYLLHPENLDSIIPPSGYSSQFNRKDGIVLLIPSNKTPEFNASENFALQFWIKGTSFEIPLKTRYFKPAKFSYFKKQNVDSMALTGDFNSWQPFSTPLSLIGDSFQTTLNLAPGNYGYQVVENKTWGKDPNNLISISNGQGGENSLLKIEPLKEDFTPQIKTVSFTDNSITIALTCKTSSSLSGFYQNHWMKIEKSEQKSEFETHFTLSIPNAAKKRDRGYIRVFCQNKFVSGNDLLIPLQIGSVITEPQQLKRSDYNTNILYFMMVDRFYNGYQGNDYKMDTNIVKPKAQFMGGDLQGILAKLKDGYFESLGINSLWISPITGNPKGAWGQFKDPDTKFSAYHGYWPTTLTTVDERFGNEKVLKELLAEAHKRNINVLLDYVAHHLHIDHPIIKQNPGWVTPLYLPDGTMNTEKWDEHRLTTWFDTFMPTLNLTDQKVTDYMVDSALHWVKDFEFDGFRHDATKHIPLNFWRTLTYKVKTEVEIPQNRSIYQIGETYGNNELISSYVNSGMLDAQFDFNLYDVSLPVFATPNESFERLSAALKQSFSYYGYNHTMGNITGNQDKPRFINYADGQITSSIPWQETKRIGWKQNIQVNDSIAYKKLGMAHAFNLTIPGVPIIYYGDEFGMPGANDPDNRRMMKFTGLSKNESELKQMTTTLAGIRKNSMALMYGDFKEIVCTPTLYGYVRHYFGEQILVLLNKGSSKINYSINPPKNTIKTVLYGSKTKSKIVENEMELEPYSVTIIRYIVKK
jgi:cyclomaltodextrinase